MMVETGIDYLSMSVPISSPQHAEWFNKCILHICRVQAEGNELRAGSFKGYDGYFCGKSFAGQRSDGSYLRVIGGGADSVFSELHEQDAHYSRLDIQVTCRIEPFDLNYVERCESAANSANSLLPDNRQREVSLRRDNRSGRTLYIGVRSSPVYCRIYNKESKSTDEHYTHCWRYEAELHNDMSTMIAHRLAAADKGIYAMISSLVYQTFNDRGISCPWTKEMERAALPPLKRADSDVDKKLTWLRTQVQPSVQFLLDMTSRDIVLEALGLAGTYPVE